MTINLEIEIFCNQCSNALEAIHRKTHWDIEPCQHCLKEVAEEAVEKYKEGVKDAN